MRTYAKKGLEILHGSLLLSAFYCIMMQLTEQWETGLLYKSLLLIPVTAILSISVRKVRHLWQFFLITVLVETGVLYVMGRGWAGIWLGVCVGLAAGSYFMGRAKHEECWLHVPAYLWLAVYVLLYLLGHRYGRVVLTQYACLGAGIYFLIYNFHMNLVQVDRFIETHADLERLPAKRLGRINQGMMWLVSGITVAGMLISPYLGMDRIMKQMGMILRQVVGWILGMLLPDGGQEMVEPEQQQAQEMIMEGVVEQPSDFFLLILKILDILGWIFAVGLVLIFIWLLLKKLYSLYRSFHAYTEENGDRIERLVIPRPGLNKRNLEKKKKENLFWDRSPNGRIRKHYKRRVLREWKEAPPSCWTPCQIEEELGLEQGEKERFHTYYEKARYAKEPCSKEDMQNMLDIR